LTPEEERTVELVEKALFVIKWMILITCSLSISNLVITWQDNQKRPAERRIVTMTQSDLREMIREEIRKSN